MIFKCVVPVWQVVQTTAGHIMGTRGPGRLRQETSVSTEILRHLPTQHQLSERGTELSCNRNISTISVISENGRGVPIA